MGDWGKTEENKVGFHESVWYRYVWSCGLLMLPIFGWNIIFTRFLPPAISSDEFWRDIPALVVYGENGFRFAVFVLPFLMPLDVKTAMQRKGLLLFVTGTIIYFLSWIVLMMFPQSAWGTSWPGFTAPAYTPVIWLTGLGILGKRLYWDLPYSWWVYVVLSLGFTGFHVMHTCIVYMRNY